MANAILTATILDYITRSWTLCKGKLRRADKHPFVALYQAVSRSEIGKNSSASLANEQCLWFHYPGTFHFHTTVPEHFSQKSMFEKFGLTFFYSFIFHWWRRFLTIGKIQRTTQWDLNTRNARWWRLMTQLHELQISLGKTMSLLHQEDSHLDPLISKLADSNTSAAERITSRTG